MGRGDRVAAAVLRGRAAIEELMVDTCRITIVSSEAWAARTFDEATATYSEPEPTVLYEGPCRVQVRSDINSNAVEAVVGDHEWTYRTLTLQLPIDGTGHIPPRARCEILTCALDPSRVGRVFGLRAETKGKTHATHRRFYSTEVLG